jgi:hypothetical protein
MRNKGAAYMERRCDQGDTWTVFGGVIYGLISYMLLESFRQRIAHARTYDDCKVCEIWEEGLACFKVIS